MGRLNTSLGLLGLPLVRSHPAPGLADAAAFSYLYRMAGVSYHGAYLWPSVGQIWAGRERGVMMKSTATIAVPGGQVGW